MREEKIVKSFCTNVGLVLIILGGIFLFVGRYSTIAAFSEPVDIFAEELQDAEEIKAGRAIETDMYLLMEEFAWEEVSSKNRAGQVTNTSSYYYYILPVFVGEDETYYVAFKTSTKNENYSTYKKIANDTMAWLYGEQDTCGNYSIKVTGGLEKLDKKIYNYMVEWFEKTEWFEDDSDIEKYVLPLEFSTMKRESVRTMFFVFGGMFIVGIILVIVGFRLGKKSKVQAQQINDGQFYQ